MTMIFSLLPPTTGVIRLGQEAITHASKCRSCAGIQRRRHARSAAALRSPTWERRLRHIWICLHSIPECRSLASNDRRGSCPWATSPTITPAERFHTASDESYSGLASCPIRTADAKEQTFSHCVRKGNITQELEQGNASLRTS